MALIVQKYGGTSVADAERITRVAERIAATHLAGNQVVAVVSAMGQTTDELVTLAGEVSPNAHPRELDMLLTAGERISMALCAMAIADLGVPAMSLTGSQAGIITTATHGHAEILEIRADRVRDGVDQGRVVIVAGFQGFSRDSRDITTLGRGGSDATAVALAASLGADACEIYTDVDGVFTADPRAVPDARKLDEVSFEEMLELAATGAGVLMTRSVEFGRRYRIPIHVRSSFHDGVGTWVKEETMEAAIVRGVSHDTSEAKVTVAGVPDKPGIAADLFEPLATAGVNVDMIVQNVSRAGVTDISFTVPKEQAPVAGDIARALAAEVGAEGVDIDRDIARVSLVGAGIKSEFGIAGQMFRILADHGINIEMISTSPVRISCVVSSGDVVEAVRRLHDGFIAPLEAAGGILVTRVAVVGATGAVGTTMVQILSERRFPVEDLRLMASARSAGDVVVTPWGDVKVEALDDADPARIEVALFSAGAARSREHAPRFAEAGAVVIDNSSAFRMDPSVPLVVTGVNDHAAAGHEGIIANPNCTTMVLMMAVGPLHRAATVRHMVATTYQSVSGAGRTGMDVLGGEIELFATDPDALARGGWVDPGGDLYPRPIGFNVIPHAGPFTDGGYTEEEWKLVNETRKILGDGNILVEPTCVRVPVMVGHSIAATLEFERAMGPAEALDHLSAAPGVDVWSDDKVPTPLDSAGADNTLVGRVRGTLGRLGGISLWAVGDNLRKGAALNAVQIAELLPSIR